MKSTQVKSIYEEERIQPCPVCKKPTSIKAMFGFVNHGLEWTCSKVCDQAYYLSKGARNGHETLPQMRKSDDRGDGS